MRYLLLIYGPEPTEDPSPEESAAVMAAYNAFTEKGFTKAHREVTESMTTDLYDQLVRGIAEGRHKTEGEVRAARRDSCRSIRARSPIASPSASSSTIKRPSRIASSLKSCRVTDAPDDAA